MGGNVFHRPGLGWRRLYPPLFLLKGLCEMYVKKEPFIIPMQREATSTSDFTAKTQPWRTGDIVVIDTVAVAIDAHKTKVVHVGVIRNEFAIYYETLRLSQNGDFFCTKAPIVIPSGYRVIVKCLAPTVGVRYTINVMGHLEVYCGE